MEDLICLLATVRTLKELFQEKSNGEPVKHGVVDGK